MLQCMFIIAYILYCNIALIKLSEYPTVSRSEHPVAQTREVECTRRVLPQVMNRGGYMYALHMHM